MTPLPAEMAPTQVPAAQGPQAAQAAPSAPVTAPLLPHSPPKVPCVQGKRVGVYMDLATRPKADPEVITLFEQAIGDLEAAGAEIVYNVSITGNSLGDRDWDPSSSTTFQQWCAHAVRAQAHAPARRDVQPARPALIGPSPGLASGGGAQQLGATPPVQALSGLADALVRRYVGFGDEGHYESTAGNCPLFKVCPCQACCRAATPACGRSVPVPGGGWGTRAASARRLAGCALLLWCHGWQPGVHRAAPRQQQPCPHAGFPPEHRAGPAAEAGSPAQESLETYMATAGTQYRTAADIYYDGETRPCSASPLAGETAAGTRWSRSTQH